MEKQPILLHTKKFDILWEDMDAYGHVNNSQYFTYMQECLFDWIYSTGLKFSPNNKAPVLAATSCKFIRPIVFPAGIAIELYAVGKDGKKIKFSHTIRDLENPEQVYALGEAEIIWFDFINNKSIHEPEEYRHLISG